MSPSKPAELVKPKEESYHMLKKVRYHAVDVSKDTLVTSFERNRWQFPNSKEGYGKLIAQIKKQPGSVQVVCEATGPYHLAMCLALQDAGIPVTISNPARIHYFGRSEGVLAKNDPIDAGLIERFANAKQPPADPPLCREWLALCEMVNHRRQLVECAKVFRINRQQVLDPAVRKEIDRSIAALERRIEAIEGELHKKVATNPKWKKEVEVLTSVKGVGFITAVVLLASMPELGTLSRGQCAALAGLAPYDDDSGRYQGRRFIRGGRSEVRCALYMAAVCAVRHNPILKKVYERLIEAKKPFKVAITAVMRKMLIYLNALLKEPLSASPA